MYFLSIVTMLLLEYFQPRPERLSLVASFLRYTATAARRLKLADTQGAFFLGVAVLPPVIVVAIASYVLYQISPLLDWLLNVAVLYFSVEFTTFSRHAHAVTAALAANRLEEAHACLEKWQHHRLDDGSEEAVVRLAVEQTLMSAYRDLFGGLAWFVVFGPAGVIAYRLVVIVDEAASDADHFAGRVLDWMDWVPSRVVALSFAIAGNFQGVWECWRSQAANWRGSAEDILLASATGALGVKLGAAVAVDSEGNVELDARDAAGADHIQSAIGMNWRVLVLWLALLLLFTWVK